MKIFELTGPREPLIKHTATKLAKEIMESGNTAFNYLCSRYPVMVDEDTESFVFYDNSNGCIISMQSEDEESALEALGHLLMLHYLVEQPNARMLYILNQEKKLFLEYYKKEQDSCLISYFK